jgi:hypothetical protein
VNALLALAASVLWGSSDFGGGLMSRRLHPSAAVLISQAIALLALVLLLPFLPVPGGWYLLIAAVAGVVATLSLASFYRAMADAPLSLVAPITAAGMFSGGQVRHAGLRGGFGRSAACKGRVFVQQVLCTCGAGVCVSCVASRG